jgi:broad specificity phosphatase PhoE
MYLYLIRHGQTDWNIEKRMQGQRNIELNKRGIEQTRTLSKKLKNYDIKKLYSSPLIRAYKTGKIIGEELGLDCKAVDELMEFNFGVWQGMTYAEIEREYKEQWDNWNNESWKVNIPKGESFLKGMERIVNTVDNLVDKNEDNLAIVTHGTSIEFYTNHILGTTFEKIRMERLVGDNGSVIKVHIDKKNNTKRIEK